MRRRRVRRRLALLVLLGAITALLAGCAVGPSQRPPVATRQTGAPLGTGTDAPIVVAPPPLLPPLQAATPRIPFADCTAPVLGALGGPAVTGGRDLRIGCAVVAVLGDGQVPSGEVAVTRVTLGPPAATGVIPVAVLGDDALRTGSDQALRLAAGGPVELLSGTALYGIDARGSGASDPVDCITPTARAAIDDASPLVTDPVGLAEVVRAASAAARTCSQILEDAVTGYRTASAADDLEQVRRALGASRLHTIALGDGAGVVADWAGRYPDGVGRTVLDGVADPTSPLLLRADQSAEAARAALAAFAVDCAGRPDCPLGTDPGAITAGVARVVGGLAVAPVPGPDGRSVTDGTAVTALVDGLADPSDWPDTAAALAAAGRGDMSGLRAPVEAREADGAGFDLALMTRCNDTSDRPTADQAAVVATRARAVDPVFGSWFVQQALTCSAWPVPTQPAALPTATPVPPLLLAGAADPSSPLPGTQRVAAQLPGATLVSWLGAGHGAYPTTPCVRAVTDAYLLGGDLPRQGTVCPP